jgi:hypothetical protein
LACLMAVTGLVLLSVPLAVMNCHFTEISRSGSALRRLKSKLRLRLARLRQKVAQQKEKQQKQRLSKSGSLQLLLPPPRDSPSIASAHQIRGSPASEGSKTTANTDENQKQQQRKGKEAKGGRKKKLSLIFFRVRKSKMALLMMELEGNHKRSRRGQCRYGVGSGRHVGRRAVLPKSPTRSPPMSPARRHLEADDDKPDPIESGDNTGDIDFGVGGHSILSL